MKLKSPIGLTGCIDFGVTQEYRGRADGLKGFLIHYFSLQRQGIGMFDDEQKKKGDDYSHVSK